MSQVINIIKKLKQENIFDNTMIIIAADHGSVYKPASFSKNMPYSSASPTLLIKPLYGNDLFQISDYPAQLSDIPKTIATAFNIPHEYSGIDLLSKGKQKNRSREFNYYVWSKEYHSGTKSRVPPITKYTIEGPLRDPMSWLFPIECEATLDFSKATQETYYFESNMISREHWGRWSYGPQVKFQFKIKPDCQTSSVFFNLTAFVTPKNPEQTAQVFINDKPVGDIAISIGEAQPKKFTFPLPISPDNTYSVRFEIDKPTSPKSVGVSGEERELGFGFVNMELLSNGSVQ
ncbi:hypothetical protein [Candidatus Regiella insecticola]|nr:hypothetical protein [Candidatus Regiella insecticola]